MALWAAGPTLLRALRRVWAMPGADTITWTLIGLTLLGVGLLWKRRARAGGWIEEGPAFAVILTAWVAAAAMSGLAFFFMWWVLGMSPLPTPGTLTPKNFEQLAVRAIGAVAILGTVAVLVLSYRKQRTSERESDRDDTRLFTERYASATAQLSHEGPASRLAGVQAMAHLVDDAPKPELAQMVISALCDFASTSNFGPDSLQGDSEQSAEHKLEEKVSRRVFSVIAERLSSDSGNNPWQGKHYEFHGAQLPSAIIRSAKFLGCNVTFTGSSITSHTLIFSDIESRESTFIFQNVKISSGRLVITGDHEDATFRFIDCAVDHDSSIKIKGEHSRTKLHIAHCRIIGNFSLQGAEFRDSRVQSHATQIGGRLDLGARWENSKFHYTYDPFESGDEEAWPPTISFAGAALVDSEASIRGLTSGTLNISSAKLERSKFGVFLSDFRDAELSAKNLTCVRSTLDFSNTRFGKNRASFINSTFEESTVDFTRSSGIRPLGLPDNLPDIRLPAAWRAESEPLQF
ncbi:hypothetical protein [Nocardiopsis sp. SBT366]|uniref:hypothetical protein n=1 Tax=Nocardiopsis sp. SBT366 TaxID=1580529 RepID=UPI0012E13D1A|nr:hypothetical protein [Nocardiopsis sp. SBT366]